MAIEHSYTSNTRRPFWLNEIITLLLDIQLTNTISSWKQFFRDISRILSGITITKITKTATLTGKFLSCILRSFRKSHSGVLSLSLYFLFIHFSSSHSFVVSLSLVLTSNHFVPFFLLEIGKNMGLGFVCLQSFEFCLRFSLSIDFLFSSFVTSLKPTALFKPRGRNTQRKREKAKHTKISLFLPPKKSPK